MTANVFDTMVNTHLSKSLKSAPYEYTAIVRANDISITLHKITAINYQSNFVDAIASNIVVSAIVSLNQFRYVLVRAHGSIDFTLITKLNNKLYSSYRYKGIVLNNRDTEIENKGITTDYADDINIQTVEFELVPEAIWYLRAQQCSHNSHGSSGMDVIKTILASTLVNNPNAKGNMLGIMPHTDEIQRKYGNIIVPDGTDFLSVFDYIQNRYGIFSRGLGVFAYLDYWWLFRPYDPDHFNITKNTRLVIYHVAAAKLGQPDRSCYVEGNTVYIITTGDITTLDNTDISALNDSTGFRVGSVRALDNRMIDYNSKSDASTTPNAYMSHANPFEHKSDVTNAKIGNKAFVDDDKAIKSEMYRKQGMIVRPNWNMSTFGILIPGMGVKFIYSDNNNSYCVRYGNLIAENFHTAIDGSVSSNSYASNTELVLWLTN